LHQKTPALPSSKAGIFGEEFRTKKKTQRGVKRVHVTRLLTFPAMTEWERRGIVGDVKGINVIVVSGLRWRWPLETIVNI